MRVCASCSRLLATDACPDDGGQAVAVERLPEATRVGPYELIELIGKGGMGHVYEAVHTELGRRVAIKFLRDELGDDELPERFLREARAVSRIDHDNVISVYDYGDGSGGAVYFVMEMLDGETLWDLNRRRGRLDPALCHHIYDQIMAALEAAHRRDVIHRDLKPTNVFIIDRQRASRPGKAGPRGRALAPLGHVDRQRASRPGKAGPRGRALAPLGHVDRESNRHFVKLLDFGLARLLGDSARPRLTIEGTVMGTPEYMSPEQIEGKPADARADIYALGTMLYESLTGDVPFPAAGTSFPALARRVLDEPPVPPSQRAPVSRALEAVVLGAMAKRPGDRFESIAAMRAAFRAAFDEDAGAPLDSALTIPSAGRLIPAAPEPAPRPRARWGIALALVLLAGAVAASVAIAAAVDRGPSTTAAAQPADAAPRTVASLWAGGDRDAAAALARSSLAADLESADPARREATGRGVVAAATPATAALLYRALDGGPALRLEAAARIAELRLFEGAAKIRAVLDRSGQLVRVQLAAALLELGDRSAVGLLEGALDSDDPRLALVAAEALARTGGGAAAEAAITRLRAIAASTPAGRDSWQRANAALHRAGDGGARRALLSELTGGDADRAVAAAAVLAAGDRAASDYLERVVADPGFAARPRAALALARLGRDAALELVDDALGGDSERETLAALAVVARLGKPAGQRYADRIASLTNSASIAVSAAARAALLAL